MAKKETAEEAAVKVLQAAQEKKLKAATEEFNTFLSAWSQKHGTALLVSGIFTGNRAEPHITVVMK